MSRDAPFQNLFHNRTGVLATMHQKEQVIAPILQDHLGVQITVPQGFNTDEFGTFTRDVKRPGDQHYTAKLKAEKAMALTGLTLAVASEGSFAPHPSIPFLAHDREIVLLRDRMHDLEIVGQAISTETNYAHQQVTTLEAAFAFAQKIGFPTHGLVAMADAQMADAQMADAQPSQTFPIFKGIIDEAQLAESVTELLKKFGRAHLETDMRAMYNPTRMQVIAEATRDLVRQINQRCPQCGCPGFALAERHAGLPCALCGLPTPLVLAVTHRCKKCDFSQVVNFPEGRQFADPAQCSYCNP